MSAKTTNDCAEFDKRVGLLSEEDLVELGWKVDNGNRICFSREEELDAFIKKLNSNPNGKKYHIATHVEADDDSYVVVNYKARVNRLDYFLCDGDQDPDLTLEEDPEDYYEENEDDNE